LFWNENGWRRWNEIGNLCGWSSWRWTRHLKDVRLQDECRCRHLRFQECTQDETRRGENTSLSFTHQFGRISLLKISNLLFKGIKSSFFRRNDWSWVYKKLTKEAIEGCLATLPLLAPKVENEGIPSRLFLKLVSKDALHNRFPSLASS